MLLTPNACFRVAATESSIAPGVYRVILDDPIREVVIAAHIIDDRPNPPSKGGRKKKSEKHRRTPERRAPAQLVGKPQWLPRGELEQLFYLNEAMHFQIERPQPRKRPCERDQRNFERRVAVMAAFLNLPTLQEELIIHGTLGRLVERTMREHGVSEAFVYTQWSNLCRWGIDETSLVTRRDRSGAPGMARPCNPGGRKKAGRKTAAEVLARAYGGHLDPAQPGYSSEWEAAVIAADRQITGNPKPAWPKRYNSIISSRFCGKAKEVDGRIKYVASEIGTYPNARQVKRILTRNLSKLGRIIERTTRRHFTSSQRGLVAHDWEGIAGPGHTWAIDSTVGDIHLRSSVNRAWIVGRPIVYIIVDVWSTAVVGFYVCLTGPKWDTAKTAIFNAAASPGLLGDIWGYKSVQTLFPHPTICYQLWCDRGEYLSRAHRVTAFDLIPHTSYTPPYRGDLKGLVEVLHRIEKDHQFLFLPGAMDYRRRELELRRVKPEDCTLTVADYMEYLDTLFTQYNLTANREKRLDAHMIADGVHPSPAGLWAWGHHVGIGYRKHLDDFDLMQKLLPENVANVKRDGIEFSGCKYSSDDLDVGEMTTLARNRGSFAIPIRHYPGPMGRIWTPDTSVSRMITLNLRDDARISPEVTQEEWSDVLTLQVMRRPYQEHNNLSKSLDALSRVNFIKSEAQRKTNEALQKARGPAPSMSEARRIEVAEKTPERPETSNSDRIRDEALEAHEDMMQALIASASHAD